MSKVRIYAKSLFANWIGYGANIVVMLFLSPFVVHSLGKTTYGVWSLLMTFTGYLGLAEIGVRVSTGRFLNYYIGQNRQDKVDKVISTSMAFYSIISLLVLGIAIALGLSFGKLFPPPKVPAELARQAMWVLPMAAVSVWMGFVNGIFTQLLQAKNRFDLRNIVMVTTLAFRAGGTVLVLKLGGTLVGLASVLVISSGISILMFIAFARWKGAEAHFSLKNVNRMTFSEVFRYGAWAFVNNLSSQVIAYTDAIVIAVLLGMEEIALYSIALVVADHGGNFVTNVFRVIVPDTAKAAGRNDLPKLHWYIIKSTRVTLLLAVPLFVGFMTLGRDFIRLWMGNDFGPTGWVLFILAFSHLSSMFRWGPTLALKAMGFVKTTALIGTIEAILNLVLSLVFVMAFGWGIYGVAAGTMIPSILFASIATLIVTHKYLRLSIREFVDELVFPAVTAGAIFGIVCLSVKELAVIQSWGDFVTSVALLILLYIPIALYVILSSSERLSVYQKLGFLFSKPESDRPGP